MALLVLVLSLFFSFNTFLTFSQKALWSGFYLEQLRIAFDAGIPMHYPLQHIFITHTHSDHAYNLPIILTETMTFQSTGYDASLHPYRKAIVG